MKKEFDLNEEIKNGYLITAEKKKVWKIELELLDKFSEICRKYNIRFFADAGTLLGTIRHRGFIPWDDDIDLVMFREDFEELLKHSTEFEYPFFLQSFYTEKGYYRGHAQFRNSNTTAILKNERDYNFKFNQGIFIDIFILDAVPDDSKELLKEKKKIDFYNKIIDGKFFCMKKKKNFKKLLKQIVLNCFNIDNVFKRKEYLLKSYSIENCKNVAPLGFIFETKKRIRDKHLYDEVVWLEFENTKIPCPKKYDEYLKQRYGNDYMTPINMSTTHGEVLLDVDNSYKKYIQ